MKLTTAKYCTPDGTFIDQKGIMPDIIVEQNNKHIEPTPSTIEHNSPLQYKSDAQYQKAYSVLQEMVLLQNTNSNQINTSTDKTN